MNEELQSLDAQSIPPFLARFSEFGDAVLREFSCKPGDEEGTSCELIFQVKDQDAPSGWSVLVMRLKNVVSWRFSMPLNCAFYVISTGVHLLHRDGLFYVDVGDMVDSSELKEDFLRSNFHFIAEKFVWQAVSVEVD